jgi:16S rRNA (adenine1518-N6/adenine1519-N6)-dimethyltransferase
MWTKTSLREALLARGQSPKKKLGQHFLVDPNFCRCIVREADLPAGAEALEIGCGPGLLTAHLAPACARLTAVEIDPDMAGLCRMVVGDVSHVRVIEQDILNEDGGVARDVGGGWLDDGMDGRLPPNPPSIHPPIHPPVASLHVFGNLPYNRSVEILVALLAWRRPVAQVLVVVQKEVGERLRAGPSTELYGPLSVVAQSCAEVERVRAVPRTVFWPAPRVESALVRLKPFGTARDGGDGNGRMEGWKDGRNRSGPPSILPPFHPRRAFSVLQSLFRHRRKRLGAALRAMEARGDVAARALAAAGASADDRAEALPPDALARMAVELLIRP